VFILGIVLSALFYSFVSPASSAIERDKITAAALAQAKDALIGYAAAHATRPGALPCPDTNNDGNGEPATASPGGNSCPNYIGRLPWKSLGLPDTRDGSGERLWYSLSPNFRNANPPSGPVLNSDTPAEITISGIPDKIIAVVIAPGAIVGAQDREAADTTKVNSAANYLDGGNENGGSDGKTFTAGPTTNDKPIAITRDSFFPPVESRVAREIGKLLRDYYDLPLASSPPDYNHYYPFAAPFSGTTCVSGTYRGRIPTTDCPPLKSFASTLPPWFGPGSTGNRWNEVMVYGVAPRCTPKIVPGFITPTPTPDTIDNAALDCNYTTTSYGTSYLSVGTSNEIQAIVLPGGYGLSGQSRPCETAADCLEDQQNTDGPGSYPNTADGADNLIYVKPQRSSTNNDSLVIVRPYP